MLLDKLKTLTRGQHDEAENLNFTSEIFAHNLSLAAYKTLLQRNYYFHLHVETYLEQLHGYTDTKISELIKLDLSLLGVEIEANKNLLQPINNDQILGLLYVRNGSLLGTKVIANQLKKTESLQDEVAQFNFYTLETKYPSWKDTIDYINSNFKSESDVIEGAHNAFAYFLKLSEKF